MDIFIVATNDYDEHKILAVFTDEDAANTFIAPFRDKNSDTYRHNTYIERWTANDPTAVHHPYYNEDKSISSGPDWN